MKSATRPLIVIVLLIAVTLGIYVGREQKRLSAQWSALEARIAASRAAIERAQRERDTADRELAALIQATKDAEAKVAAAQSAIATANPAIAAWEQKVATLRSFLAQHQEWAIPEIDLLSRDEFIFFARDAKLGSEEENRQALRGLRALAKRKLAREFHDALDEYAVAHDGRLPSDFHELTSLFKIPVSDAMLSRYALTGAPSVSALSGSNQQVLYERAPVDELYDTRQLLGLRGSAQMVTNAEIYVVARALAAYGEANAGRKPTQSAELSPFLEAPLDVPMLDRYFSGWQKNPATLGIERYKALSIYGYRAIGAARPPVK